MSDETAVRVHVDTERPAMPADDLTHSAEINEIATALAKAQAETKNAIKTQNNQFKGKYADLADVMDACREALTKNDIAVLQSPGRQNGDVALTTMLLHKSGQWFRGRCWVQPAKLDPQGFGSVTSYLRRYSLAAMVGIAQEDDDGEGATDRTIITEEQAAALNADILKGGKSITKMCEFFGVASLAELTVTDHDRLRKLLEKKESTRAAG